MSSMMRIAVTSMLAEIVSEAEAKMPQARKAVRVELDGCKVVDALRKAGSKEKAE